MAIKKVEIQDSTGNVYHPHTDASVVQGLPSVPNLLLNSEFTVNQRGAETYTGNGYQIDRWCTHLVPKVQRLPNTSPSVAANQLNFTLPDSGAWNVYQPVEEIVLNGSTVTAGFWAKATKAASATFCCGNKSQVCSITTAWKYFNYTLASVGKSTDYSTNGWKLTGVGTGAVLSIAFPRLAYGDFLGAETHADPVLEEQRCKRYFQKSTTMRFNLYLCDSLTAFFSGNGMFDAPMRVTPTATFTAVSLIDYSTTAVNLADAIDIAIYPSRMPGIRIKNNYSLVSSGQYDAEVTTDLDAEIRG